VIPSAAALYAYARAYVAGVHVPEFIPGGHHTERRVHTKKMQRQVERLLKRAFALARKAEL
jgi:hypothetical protein